MRIKLLTAIYMHFEYYPMAELEFYIAQKLSMTVQEMRKRMSNFEFLQWCIYYGRIAQRHELAEKEAKGVSSI